MVFENRRRAGELLAPKIASLGYDAPIILALPRGGVPVAYEIAKVLKAPLTVIGVSKISAPLEPELAIGAVAENEVEVLDDHRIRLLDLKYSTVKQLVKAEKAKLKRRLHLYRRGYPLPDLDGQTVMLVDDGLATGMTALAAAAATKAYGPEKIVFVSPVCAAPSAYRLQAEVDEIVCGNLPSSLDSVSKWYRHFPALSDSEVLNLLNRHRLQYPDDSLVLPPRL